MRPREITPGTIYSDRQPTDTIATFPRYVVAVDDNNVFYHSYHHNHPYAKIRCTEFCDTANFAEWARITLPMTDQVRQLLVQHHSQALYATDQLRASLQLLVRDYLRESLTVEVSEGNSRGYVQVRLLLDGHEFAQHGTWLRLDE